MRITASGRTDVGRQRDHNEDACLIDPDLGLYIVCDGLGGHAAGEIASQETVRLVQESVRRQRAILGDYIRTPTFEQRTQALRLVEGAVQEACSHVYAMGQSDPMKKGMGTTIAMLLTLGEAAVIAHAGDSREYRKIKRPFCAASPAAPAPASPPPASLHPGRWRATPRAAPARRSGLQPGDTRWRPVWRAPLRGGR